MSQDSKRHVVEIFGGDRIEAVQEGGRWTFSGVMCAECRSLLQSYVEQGADPVAWVSPEGNSHSALLLRELILKIKGEWNYPYPHLELCHCRAIPTENVDQAILSGAHTAESVSQITSASTACGTCRPEVLAILDYRLSG